VASKRKPARPDRSPRNRAPAKPHAIKRAEKQVLSADQEWAHTVAELVGGDCHAYQRHVLEDVYTHGQRFITMLVGRGGGKTSAIRALFLTGMTRTRRGRFLYFATTREAAEELLWEPMKALVAFHGWQDEFEFLDSKLRVTCKRTGATLRLYGMDKPRHVEQHRGKPFDGVAIDEAASHDIALVANMLDRIIGPRLDERMGWMVLAGTPGHFLSGDFYNFTRPGSTALDENDEPVPLHRPWEDRDKPEFAGWDGWCSHHWKLSDVIALPNPPIALVNLWNGALKKKRRNRWSDENPIWLREYMGQWAADDTGMVFKYRALKDGQPWNQWDPFDGAKLIGLQALMAAVAKLPKKSEGVDLLDWRFVIAGDKGSTDPFALNVFAFSPNDPARNIWHVMPFERTAMYARLVAEIILGGDFVAAILRGAVVDFDRAGGVVGVTGWPDAAVCDADQAFLDELANVYGFRMKKAERKPDYKMGAIELVNGDLVDGRIKIIKASHLESQVMALQWAVDDHGRVKENKAQANHSSDTLIYGRREISHLFESGSVEQPPPTSSSAVYQDPQGLTGGEDRDAPHDRMPDLESGLAAEYEFRDPWG
jgi:hypothetical protein